MADASLHLFNAQWYLSQNSDVAAAVARGEITAQEHFELFGKTEGRSAGPLFNATEYLQGNPDVAAAVARGDTNAYDHFVQFGAGEGRSPISVLNINFYLSQNPDVAEAVQAGAFSAIEHLLQYGLNEGRQILPFLNLDGYLDANPDVAEAVGSGQTDPLTHVLQYGIAEGRLLSNGVDLSFFANDPAFNQAIADGRFEDALGRVSEVAPFLPTFTPPTGWVPAADTPIPQGFVPPAGQYLVVPDSVTVPGGSTLPDAFGPQPNPGGGGDNPPGPYFLTPADDTIVGTAGDDAFFAGQGIIPMGITLMAPGPMGTLNNGDNLDGAGGRDALIISQWGYMDGTAPTIKNIEVVKNAYVGVPYEVGGSWTNYAILDLVNTSGIEELWTDFAEHTPGPSGIISGIYHNASLSTQFGVSGV